MTDDIPLERTETGAERSLEVPPPMDVNKVANRSARGLFGPGNQAGKGRRGVDALVRAKARGDALKSIEVLIELRDDTDLSPKIRRDAALDILAYAVGKPREMTEEQARRLDEELGDFVMSEETVAALLKAGE